MTLSAESLTRLAGETGFRIEFLEKVDRLVDLLQALFADVYLEGRLALKGGTALNLFHFHLPRLSVDIDLNFIGAVDRETMLEERPLVEQRIQAIAGRQNLSLVRAPTSHAGCKWSFRYSGALGGGGTLEVDLNYLYRQPLWPLQRLDSHPLGPIAARAIPVLDIHELAGGKLAALFSRTAARDLFDTHHLLTISQTEETRLRTAFILYGAMNRRDWRTIMLDDITVDYRDARRNLFPLLVQHRLKRRHEQDEMLDRLIGETRQALEAILPLDENALDFLNHLLEDGNIRPDLLDLETGLANIVNAHPALLWRAQQARR